MVKKILSLTVAIMLLSVTVFASLSNSVILVQASEAVTTVSVESHPAVDDDGALTGSATLKITPAESKNDVTVVTGVFSIEGEFLGAAVEPEFDLTAEVAEEKTIAMPTVSVTEDSKYVVNFYLWEKSTLAPLTGVTSITVEPAVLDIEPLEVLWKDYKGENKLGDGTHFTATMNSVSQYTKYDAFCRLKGNTEQKITMKITRTEATKGKYKLYLYTVHNDGASGNVATIRMNGNNLGTVAGVFRGSSSAELPAASGPIEITLNAGENIIEFVAPTNNKQRDFFGYKLEYVGSN